MIDNSKKWQLCCGSWNSSSEEIYFYERDFSYPHVENIKVYDYDFFYYEIYNFEYSNKNCIYEMSECIINEGDVVVDLGSNVGFFTHYASQKASRVISVEGSPEIFDCLVKNNIENKNVEFLNANIVPENSKMCKTWGDNPTKLVIKLSEIFERFNLDRIDFLKMDIENTEYELINDLSDELISKIGKISIETHYNGRNYEILEKLKSKKSYYFNLYKQSEEQQTMLYFY